MIILTVVTALFVQVPIAPVTVYVVVMVGVAVTVDKDVELKLPPGFQVYVLPPDTVNVLELPKQIADDGETVKFTALTTLTVTTALAVDVDEHDETPERTVYVVVTEGDAITLLPVAELKLPEGFHV